MGGKVLIEMGVVEWVGDWVYGEWVGKCGWLVRWESEMGLWVGDCGCVVDDVVCGCGLVD